MDNRLTNILNGFDGKRVLVVGDLMLDEYVWGNVSRISPEAPVMVLEVAGDSDFRPGGAANVVHNVQALGAMASVIGVVGDDTHGRRLKQQLADAGVDVDGVVIDRSRPTTRKTRIIAHNQQVVRVDRERSQEISSSVANRLLERLERQIPTCDAVLFSDYNKGMMTTRLVSDGIKISNSSGKIATSNPKPMNVLKFSGATVVTLNQSEAQAAAGIPLDCQDNIRSAGLALVQDLNAGAVVITLGSAGLCVCERGDKATFVPATPVEVYDVAGAGDTVISAMTLALSSGADFVEAAALANSAGGAVVRKVGVATVTREEIIELSNGFGRKGGN